MENWMLTIVIALIGSGIFSILLNRFFAKLDEKKGTKRALRLFMKDRLRYLCDIYLSREWIYEDELEDLLAMYESYQDDTDGNGYVTDVIDRVKHLEVKRIGVK